MNIRAIRGMVAGIFSAMMMLTPFPGAAEIPPGTTIRTCNDGGEWPPYIYFKRENGVVSEQAVGYDRDVFEKIFPPHGFDFTIELIAWSRCLHEVETGEIYEMVSSVAKNAEREAKYLMTDPYYTVQPHYFYPITNYPNGLKISSVEEFANYKICGLRGYNYANFGVPVETLDLGTKIFPELIEKTERKRCDIFLGRYEIFSGFAQTGTDYIKLHNLGTAPMPGVRGDKFYMMISRNYEHAEELKQIINQGIAELAASGEDEQLLAPYLK